jgi:hypothetical protein
MNSIDYSKISEDQFVPLTCVDNIFLGKFEINKLGEVKNLETNNILSTRGISSGYNVVKLRIKVEDGSYITKNYFIHILLAKTFIPNPDNKPIVDHINRIKTDFSLSNLRWVTYSENNLNRSSNGRKIECFYLRVDDTGKEYERISVNGLPKKDLGKLNWRVHNGKKKKDGTYWIYENSDLNKYIDKFGPLSEEEWETCLRFPELECNPIGLIRKGDSKQVILGTKTLEGYRKIFYKGRGYMVHRLVYETFSGRLLEESEYVDHISTNRLDNRFINLRSGTHTDNMNNPITISKREKPIKKYSIDGTFLKEYSSAEELGKELGVTRSNARDGVTKTTIYKGFVFCYSGEEYKILEKIRSSRIVFKYNSDKILVAAYISIRSTARDKNCSSKSSIQKYIDTGKLAPDGHYYYHGPHEFDVRDEQIKNQI